MLDEPRAYYAKAYAAVNRMCALRSTAKHACWATQTTSICATVRRGSYNHPGKSSPGAPGLLTCGNLKAMMPHSAPPNGALAQRGSGRRTTSLTRMPSYSSTAAPAQPTPSAENCRRAQEEEAEHADREGNRLVRQVRYKLWGTAAAQPHSALQVTLRLSLIKSPAPGRFSHITQTGSRLSLA